MSKNRNQQKLRKEMKEGKKAKTSILKQIEPLTQSQADYMNAIDRNSYTFAIGHPGTGKTFLALHAALKAFYNKEVKKIIVVRPMIQANNYDEKLGALPGSIKEKLQPWAGGLIDNMLELVPEYQVDALINSSYIEFVSMVLCRGRSWNDTFIIVEEAQNIDSKNNGMKMLLTRLGTGSKMVICGDLKQSDLKHGTSLALREAIKLFHGQKGFGTVSLSLVEDIVRNPLIRTVLDRYGDFKESSVTIDDIINS